MACKQAALITESENTPVLTQDMAEVSLSICVAYFCASQIFAAFIFKVPPSEHLACSQTALDFELVHITAWQCTAATHQWEKGSSNKARSYLRRRFRRRHTCLERVRRLSKAQRIASPLMGGLAGEAPRFSSEGLSLWVSYLLGTKAVGLPSGPLCSENTPRWTQEQNNWIKAEAWQSFSLSGTLQ